MNFQYYLESGNVEFDSQLDSDRSRPLKRCHSDVSTCSADSDDESVGPAFQKYKPSSPSSSSTSSFEFPSSEPKAKKGAWSADEDEKLFKNASEILFSNKNQSNSAKPKRLDWRAVAQYIPCRNSKQCRERWVNHLDPSIVRGGWNTSEDIKLLRLAEEAPNQWAKLARQIPGRTENMVKVRFHTLMRMKNKNELPAVLKNVVVERESESESESEEESVSEPETEVEVPQLKQERHQDFSFAESTPMRGCSSPMDDSFLLDPFMPMPYVQGAPTEVYNSFELFDDFYFQEEPSYR